MKTAAAQLDVPAPLIHTELVAASPYLLALHMMHHGVKEIPGPRQNYLIAAMNWLAKAGASEDPPWCGSGVNFCHWMLGYECSTKPALAQSWKSVGVASFLEQVQRGDVVVLWRSSPTSWKGHVGFFHAWADAERSAFYMLGGNQSNAWTIAKFPVHRVLAVRRPKRVVDLSPYFDDAKYAPSQSEV